MAQRPDDEQDQDPLLTQTGQYTRAPKVSHEVLTKQEREELLKDLPMGKEIEVMIPALDKKRIKAKVYYISDMGAYAVWHATKATGEYDSRTFKIKARPVEQIPDLRPGMSIIYDMPD